MMAINIFKKIIDGEMKADVIYQDDQCLAFRDINPQAPTHVLIIPRREIRTHADLADGDAALMGHLHVAARTIAKQLGLTEGYRLIINCQERAGQTVPHLHMHLLGGRDFTWPPG